MEQNLSRAHVKILRALKKQGLTFEKVERRLHMSAGTMSRLFSVPDRHPSLLNSIGLWDLFGVTPRDWFKPVRRPGE